MTDTKVAFIILQYYGEKNWSKTNINLSVLT